MEAVGTSIEEYIQALNEENAENKLRVESLENEAKELSSKILEADWNIKKIEFAKFNEGKEISEQRLRMRKMEDQMRAAEEKWTSFEIPYKETKGKLQQATTELTALKAHLEQLKEADEFTNRQLLDYQRNVQILKNRNAAMMLKLKKHYQDLESQINSHQNQTQHHLLDEEFNCSYPADNM